MTNEDFDDRKPETGARGWPPGRGGPGSEPMLNLPVLIAIFAAMLIAIHAVREYLLTNEQNLWMVAAFAFIPLRYGMHAAELPIQAAAWWSPVTYSLLHGSWIHLLVNLLWLVAFGSPVVRRLGSLKAIVLALLASLAGAGAHYLSYSGEMVPVIGASAVVSGYMGAAARFAFVGRRGMALNVHGPAQSLIQSFSNPGFLAFLFAWLVINLVSGAGILVMPNLDVAIAWQAHVGGFLAGLLSFSLLDRHR